MSFKKLLLVLSFISASVGGAHATTYLEQFNDPFPNWEQDWLAQNSNLTNYYGVGAGRGNNPDGLWIGESNIIFNSSVVPSITALSFDVAGWTNLNIQVLDANGQIILNSPFTANYGAYSNPGIYEYYSITSDTGISQIDFVGANVLGNTSIDNVSVTIGSVQGSNVPEPESLALVGLGLAGLGFMCRKAKKT